MLNSCFQQAANKKVEIHFLPGKNAISHVSFAGRSVGTSLTGNGPIVLEPDISWVILLTAGLPEVVWAIGPKYIHGFTRLTPGIITITTMIVSIVMLSRAIRALPTGTAYAIRTGIGTIGVAIAGISLLGEPTSPARLLSPGLIVADIIGLKLSTH